MQHTVPWWTQVTPWGLLPVSVRLPVALTFLGMPLKSGVHFSLSPGPGWIAAPHSLLVGSAWLESHPGQLLQRCLLLLSTAPPAGRYRTLSLYSPSPSEGETSPTCPHSCRSQELREQRGQEPNKLGPLEPKSSGTLTASVSTDEGRLKDSPGCCQAYTSVATFPSRLLSFPRSLPKSPAHHLPLCLTYIFTRVHAKHQRQPPPAPPPAACVLPSQARLFYFVR